MRRDSDAVVFWLATASAASTLVSIVAMEVFLAAAVLVWIVTRSAPLRLPSYFLPLGAFMVITVLSMVFSPDPGAGWHQVEKIVLFPIGLLAAGFVTTEERAEKAYKLLL